MRTDYGGNVVIGSRIIRLIHILIYIHIQQQAWKIVPGGVFLYQLPTGPLPYCLCCHGAREAAVVFLQYGHATCCLTAGVFTMVFMGYITVMAAASSHMFAPVDILLTNNV